MNAIDTAFETMLRVEVDVPRILHKKELHNSWRHAKRFPLHATNVAVVDGLMLLAQEARKEYIYVMEEVVQWWEEKTLVTRHPEIREIYDAALFIVAHDSVGSCVQQLSYCVRAQIEEVMIDRYPHEFFEDIEHFVFADFIGRIYK